MTWEIHLKTKVQLGQTEHLNSPQNLQVSSSCRKALYLSQPPGSQPGRAMLTPLTLPLAHILSWHPSILPVSPWLSPKDPENFL